MYSLEVSPLDASHTLYIIKDWRINSFHMFAIWKITEGKEKGYWVNNMIKLYNVVSYGNYVYSLVLEVPLCFSSVGTHCTVLKCVCVSMYVRTCMCICAYVRVCVYICVRVCAPFLLIKSSLYLVYKKSIWLYSSLRHWMKLKCMNCVICREYCSVTGVIHIQTVYKIKKLSTTNVTGVTAIKGSWNCC